MPRHGISSAPSHGARTTTTSSFSSTPTCTRWDLTPIPRTSWLIRVGGSRSRSRRPRRGRHLSRSGAVDRLPGPLGGKWTPPRAEARPRRRAGGHRQPGGTRAPGRPGRPTDRVPGGLGRSRGRARIARPSQDRGHRRADGPGSHHPRVRPQRLHRPLDVQPHRSLRHPRPARHLARGRGLRLPDG